MCIVGPQRNTTGRLRHQPLPALSDEKVLAHPHEELGRFIRFVGSSFDDSRWIESPPCPPRAFGQPFNTAYEIVQPLVDAGELAPPDQIQLSGSADDLRCTRQALQWNFLLALIITYLLMAALFESFLYPFVIILSVPPALAGGILGLEVVNRTLTYQPLDILTILGFVILIGVVVNNAILIVHQTLNILRDAPETPIKEAIRDAVFSRVRPIFMSSITSALGMLPIVIFSGAGSELYRGLGSVVIGGLLWPAPLNLDRFGCEYFLVS